MKLLYCFLMMQHFQICISIKSFFEIESPHPSNVMKDFINRIIYENYHQKDGFLFVIVNEIEPEYSDFIMKKLCENATAINIDFYVYRHTESIILSPSHFKFAIADPEGDITYASQIFKRVRASRARIVLLLTKKPLPILVDYILSSYSKIQCINVIIAYESDGIMEIITYNPYLRSSKKIENLTNSQKDIFYDKTRDLQGTKIRALLTYRDRTKLKKVVKNGKIHYEGKDYLAIQTLLSHINANMEMIGMDNIILNPFFESLIIGNRNERQLKVLDEKNINLLIKSERFTVDDEVVDNLYPHAQNDLKSLVPKSSEISIGTGMAMVFSPFILLINVLMILFVALMWIIIKKLHGKVVHFEKILFDIVRIFITNNLVSFPRNSLERILVVSWLLSMFILDVFIQTKITSYLAVRKYYPEIDTIEDLISSGLPLYSIAIHIEELKKKYAGTKYENDVKSIIPLATNEGFMDQMFYRTDVSQMPAFLSEHDIALFISRGKNFRKNGAQVYHLVKESIIPNYQSYKVVHNSPLLPILNRILRRLEEGGFIDLWAKGTIYNATVEGFLYPEDYDDTRITKPLTLDMTLIWFHILFVGWALSFLTFIAEVIIHKKKENTKIPFLM